MLRRAVEISRDPCSLVTRDEQLLILRREGGPPKPLPANPPNLVGSIPCEDLGMLIVDERDTTYTHGLLTFARMQFSVYIRHSASRENAEVHMARVEAAVPPNGEVRIITITDKQFERMRVFWGKSRQPTEPPPAQLELF